MSDTPVDVPLLEILDSVPLNGRAIWDTSSTSSRSIPYGNICYQSALRIRNLERELTEARRDLDIACHSLDVEREALCAALSVAAKLTEELTAHKEALNVCQMALCAECYTDAIEFRDEAFTLIAKLKEGK